MHPRNPYRDPPGFAQLAEVYPPLKQYIIASSRGTPTINFRDDAAQRCLTQALLHRDFGLTLSLPEDRICPPVPNRLNYVLWVQDIIRAGNNNGIGIDDISVPVRGIDVGTGASAIYPLLACSLEPSWTFVATDIDTTSLSFARENVATNGLEGRVHVMGVSPEGRILLPLALDQNSRLDFTMCNPPFYGSKDEIERSAKGKEVGPNAVCTGAEVEMITPGGESEFVGRMVTESLEYGTRCRWYTSMLGKLSSLTDIIALLRRYSIDNYGVTEFVQGSTRRWAVVWSFSDVRLPDTLTRTPTGSFTGLLPIRNTLQQAFPLAASAEHLYGALRAALACLDGLTVEKADGNVLVVSAERNTWSRAARRGKRVKEGPEEVMVSRMACEVGTLIGEWVKGKERRMWEGFWNHLVRKIAALLDKNESH